MAPDLAGGSSAAARWLRGSGEGTPSHARRVRRRLVPPAGLAPPRRTRTRDHAAAPRRPGPAGHGRRGGRVAADLGPVRTVDRSRQLRCRRHRVHRGRGACWPPARTTARCGSGTPAPAAGSAAPSPATPSGSKRSPPSSSTADPAGRRQLPGRGTDSGPGHRGTARRTAGRRDRQRAVDHRVPRGRPGAGDRQRARHRQGLGPAHRTADRTTPRHPPRAARRDHRVRPRRAPPPHGRHDTTIVVWRQ